MKSKVFIILSISIFFSGKGQDIDVFALTSQKNPSLEEVQQAVEYNLDQARMHESEKIVIPYPFQFDYFSEKARLRLVELFENKWTEVEIQSELRPKLSRLFDTLNSAKGFYRDVKKIAKKDSLPVQKVFDSLLEIRRNEYKTRIVNNKISIRLVMKAAYLKDDRFIPYIQELLDDPDYGNDDELNLALARYGIEPYHTEIIKKNSFNVFKNTPNPKKLFRVYGKSCDELKFTCSKESIDELLKFIDTKERVYEPSFGNYGTFIAESPIANLASIFKSKELKKELDDLRNIGIDPEVLERARKLVVKYFANYKIDDINCEKTSLGLGW